MLFQDKNIYYKNQRILDSEDEDLKIKDEDVDLYNIEKREIKEDLNDNLKINSIFFGYGVPLRTPSYILGYNPNYSYTKKNDNNKKNFEFNNNNNNMNTNKFRKNNFRNINNNNNINNMNNMHNMNNMNNMNNMSNMNQMFKK